jgi:hypothetical protein
METCFGQTNLNSKFLVTIMTNILGTKLESKQKKISILTFSRFIVDAAEILPPIFEKLTTLGEIREAPTQFIAKDGSRRNMITDSNMRYKDGE